MGNKSEITTTLAKGIYEKNPSFLSTSTYLLFWMILIGSLVGFAFQKLGTMTTGLTPEVTLSPSMTLKQMQEELDKAKSGSVFLLKRGVYYGKLFLKDKQDIVLKGEEGARIENSGPVLQILNCQNIYIRHLKLEGIEKETKEGILSVSRGSDIFIENVIFSGNMIGATLYNVDQVHFKGCQFKELRAGVHISQCQKVTFQANLFQLNREYALHFIDNSEIILNAQNRMERNEGNGIHGENSRLNMLEANQIEANKYGIFLENCSNSEIKNSTISKNKNDGIYLKNCKNMNVENNEINENNLGKGLLVENTDIQIRGNRFLKNLIGLSFEGRECKVNSMINNTIQEHQSYGVIIQKNAIEGVPLESKILESNSFSSNKADLYVEK